MFIIQLLTAIIVVLVTGVTVLGNGLPMPVFYASFHNAPADRDYYVILLTSNSDYYPAFEDVGIHGDLMRDEQLEQTSIPAFLESYEDPDGLVFNDDPIVRCSGNTYNGYFIPTSSDHAYRFLIYWDDTGEYKITDTFTLGESNLRYYIDLSKDGDTIPIKDITVQYGISRHIPAVLILMAFTAGTEWFIALIFDFGRKKEQLTVIVTNLVTNLIANVICLISLPIYIYAFAFIEAGAIIAENAIYKKRFDKDRSWKRILAYTITANIITAVCGTFLYFIITLFQGYSR